MSPVARSNHRLVAAAVAALVLAGCGSTTPTPPTTTGPSPSVEAVASSSPTSSELASVVPSASAGLPSAPATSEAPAGSLEPATSPEPSPSGSPTPTPAPTPSPDPVIKTWPFQTAWTVADALFRPDGGVVVMEVQADPAGVRLVALDAAGQVEPGWPWLAPAVDPVVGYPAVNAALASDGSVVVVAGTRAGASSVHRLDRTGQEQPGYPVQVATNGFCHTPLLAASGTAYVTCDLQDLPDGDTVRAATFALRPDGSTVAGWPIRTGPTAQDPLLAANGTLYLAIAKKGSTRLAAYGPGGRLRAGWPRTVRTGASLALGPLGRLWVTWRTYGLDAGQCGLPVWTRYEILARNGRTLSGWPVSVAGWSSDPTIGRDGTTYVASQRGLMTAYTSAGAVKTGWPVAIPVHAAACYGGSSPQLAGGGTVLIAGPKTRFGSTSATGVVTKTTTGGSRVAGWPALVAAGLATECPSCVPGPGPIIEPAIGARRIYVGAYSGDIPRVVVFDRTGHRPPAAQRKLAASGQWQLAWIRVAPTGRVWTLISGEESGGILQPIAQDRVLPTP